MRGLRFDASASVGLVIGIRGIVGALVFFGLVEHQLFQRIFVKRRLGNDVALGSPVAQVELLAPLAAKWKFRLNFGIGRFAADGALMFHRPNLRVFIIYCNTRKAAPVAIRCTGICGGITATLPADKGFSARRTISVTRPTKS